MPRGVQGEWNACTIAGGAGLSNGLWSPWWALRQWVTVHPLVVKHYLRTWFTIDAASVFPFDLVLRDENSRITRLIRLARLAKVLQQGGGSQRKPHQQ